MKGIQIFQIISTNTQLCLIELFSNKTRSIITSFGIFIGAISLLVNISFLRAIDNDVKEEMEIIGGLNILTIKTKLPANKTQSRLFSRSPGLKIEDAYELKKRIGYIENYISYKELSWGPVKANSKTSWASINAVNEDYFKTYKVEIQKGRYFSNIENKGKEPVCIVGTRIISRLFGNINEAIGKIITINKINFKIIGIIKTDNELSWRSSQLFLPYQYYKSNFVGSKNELDEFSIVLKNSTFELKSKSDINRVLLELHRGIEDFYIETNSSKIKEMKNASHGIQIILYSIAGISLFIGGISIMNIMFATIGDRIREIGIRKSIGASKLDIIIQFLVESIFLCLIGGFPGIIIGASVTCFPKGFFPFNPELLLSDYLLSISFIVITGLLSGLIPAIKASNMQPAEALKY